jgi:hypothetical protein
MPFNNGSGSGGGNGSVWWAVAHGSEAKGFRRPALANRLRAAGLGSAAGSDASAKAMLGSETIELETPDGPPGPQQIKIGKCVEGHDDTRFSEIGYPDHPGMFRVRLRFRDIDMKTLQERSPTTHALVQQHGRRDPSLDPESLFLEVDVPAIEREPPTQTNGEWPKMPWEIHWGW